MISCKQWIFQGNTEVGSQLEIFQEMSGIRLPGVPQSQQPEGNEMLYDMETELGSESSEV